MSRLSVNSARLAQHLDALAMIGALPGGGVCRLAFSEADKAGRDAVAQRMRALGLAVSIDAIGNLLGVRQGRESGPLVLMGSHTDTVATGGRYDGSLGVLAALEVIEVLNENRISTDLPIGVISFANEEGARFMPDMMGSLYLRGDLALEDLRKVVGTDGTTLGENIDRWAYGGTDDFRALPIKAFVEVHIEQGPVLEAAGLTIGVVEAVQGIRWITFTLSGRTGHAGATPLAHRRDAGFVAGAIVHFVRQLAMEMGEPQRATVGSLTLEPNIVNVVADHATLTVDLRNPDVHLLDEAEARLYAFVDHVAAEEGVAVAVHKTVDVAPATFDPALVDLIENKAQQLGYGCCRLTSGAGHDAQIMALHCPSAMIFVPSQGGLSHNIEEYTSPADNAAGAAVLLYTVMAVAGSDWNV